MITGMLRKGILYIKGIQDVGLFATMGYSKWFAAFTGTPLFYVMLPFIGVLMTFLAIINAYELATSNNKNFDAWFNFIFSVIAATCASVSLYGTAIATAMGITFAAGPWFFLAGVLSGAIHQSVMLALNLYRAYESRDELAQRSHFIQSALNNLFILGLLLAITGAITFVLLTPIAPIVGSICAFTAVSLTTADIFWHLTPTVWKNYIKNKLGIVPIDSNISNIGHEMHAPATEQATIKTANDTTKPSIANHQQRLFSYPDLSEIIKGMDQKRAEQYIRKLITNKIQALTSRTAESDKNAQKFCLLTDVLVGLDNHQMMSKDHALENYPEAFQSFWAEVGEVEQLFNATMKCIGNKSFDSEEQLDIGLA
ncbi:hypothetical protein [Legionella waltersii]|uniref:Uncharacterized protein n=1 Tax=Legionella waltersii TaxID=66969 RepID=A0A0W1AAS3_9GAMM|nr:hypothetical protein [Legionella waltersii]KTD78392.1 hypothetical protein Lwal_1827 [Legionella waltersii]SNV06282.1 Uncharacterised protein [Legionella waltersii]